MIASGQIICEYISETGKDQKHPEKEIDKVHRARARFTWHWRMRWNGGQFWRLRVTLAQYEAVSHGTKINIGDV